MIARVHLDGRSIISCKWTHIVRGHMVRVLSIIYRLTGLAVRSPSVGSLARSLLQMIARAAFYLATILAFWRLRGFAGIFLRSVFCLLRFKFC
ncbi:hypothetical protein EOS_42315 [Caballeronia mineralivorans PML1(12)]|uniref:Uncharacterized protein n=1 Tax=Caballeronia mineralivorans PML1(12) TaxID=908627 RepID=A0A0J1CHQ2_9BURK|nr:hypothetical protein EOS_42315 [Caballeronia mineralivorans PML1(12)]